MDARPPDGSEGPAEDPLGDLAHRSRAEGMRELGARLRERRGRNSLLAAHGGR
jgi:hypothetical protein